jgi:hypothetical protein
LDDTFALFGNFTLFTSAVSAILAKFSGLTGNFYRHEFVSVVSTGFAGRHVADDSSYSALEKGVMPHSKSGGTNRRRTLIDNSRKCGLYHRLSRR